MHNTVKTILNQTPFLPPSHLGWELYMIITSKREPFSDCISIFHAALLILLLLTSCCCCWVDLTEHGKDAA